MGFDAREPRWHALRQRVVFMHRSLPLIGQGLRPGLVRHVCRFEIGREVHEMRSVGWHPNPGKIVYLAAGSQQRIAAHPEAGDSGSFVLPVNGAAQALQRGELVVYDASGPRLRNITALYAAIPRETKLPERLDAAVPLNRSGVGIRRHQRPTNNCGRIRSSASWRAGKNWKNRWQARVR